MKMKKKAKKVTTHKGSNEYKKQQEKVTDAITSAVWEVMQFEDCCPHIAWAHLLRYFTECLAEQNKNKTVKMLRELAQIVKTG